MTYQPEPSRTPSGSPPGQAGQQALAPGLPGRRVSIDVLLATYQGEAFLRAQLDSLFAQDLGDFDVIVSDDGSTDGTLDILAGHADRFPDRMRLLPNDGQRRGPAGNFARLIAASEADYIFFCDQDDIWLPDKMRMSLDHLREQERRHGPDTPVLVHTDLTVIAQDGSLLGESFFRYCGIRPGENHVIALLTNNVATGCTSVINRVLRDIIHPVPVGGIMYDHWTAQVAAATGVIACLRRPTVLYRQHAHNAVGAVRADARSFLARVRDTLTGWRAVRVMEMYVRNASRLDDRVGGHLSPRQRRRLAAIGGLLAAGPVARVWTLIRHNIRKQTILASIGLFVVVLRLPREGGQTR